MADKKFTRTELGRELAKLRIDFDEKGADMAGKLDMSASNLYNIETGQTNVSYDLIIKIKEIYGKDLEKIYLSGGGLSKVQIELDALNETDRLEALRLWRVAQGIEAPELTQTHIPAEDPVPPAVADDDKKEVEKKAPAHVPPALPDDVGFLSDDELDEIDAL